MEYRKTMRRCVCMILGYGIVAAGISFFIIRDTWIYYGGLLVGILLAIYMANTVLQTMNWSVGKKLHQTVGVMILWMLVRYGLAAAVLIASILLWGQTCFLGVTVGILGYQIALFRVK